MIERKLFVTKVEVFLTFKNQEISTNFRVLNGILLLVYLLFLDFLAKSA